MRVGERGSSSQVRAEATGGGFAEALRRARGEGVERRGGAEAARRRPAALPEPGPGAPADARVEAGRFPALIAGSSPAASDPAPAPEIAALVRTVPPAIAAAVARQGAPLAIAFGRSLYVELRAGAAGVEVVLRPAPPLARAAEAELPRLVEALRIRGVAVARAEVRPRGGGGRRAR